MNLNVQAKIRRGELKISGSGTALQEAVQHMRVGGKSAATSQRKTRTSLSGGQLDSVPGVICCRTSATEDPGEGHP